MPRILLVEDNEMNRDMLSRRLVRNGYAVVSARWTGHRASYGVVGATGPHPDGHEPTGDGRLGGNTSDQGQRCHAADPGDRA